MNRINQPFAFDGNLEWEPAGEGIRRKILTYNAEVMMVRVAFEKGAVGEIAGWAYDSAGRVVDSTVNERNAALPLTELQHTRMIGVSGSPDRVIAISAALRGGLLGGLITDERTGLALLRARTSLDSAA